MSLNCGENFAAKFQGLSRLDKKKRFQEENEKSIPKL